MIFDFKNRKRTNYNPNLNELTNHKKISLVF